MADENKDKAKGAKPELTPEQEAEIAAKKAARAEAKAKGGKAPKGGGAAKEVAAERVKRDGPARLRKLYATEIRQKLIQEFGLTNPMQSPKLTKITINMGLGEAITNNKLIEQGEEQMMAITGQKGVVTRSRKSIANFKLRQGQAIGAAARYDSMYDLHRFRVGLNYHFGVDGEDKKGEDRGPGSWEIHGQTTFIFQGYPPRAQAYVGERLEQEGWFDAQGWEIRDWFPESPDRPDGPSSWSGPVRRSSPGPISGPRASSTSRPVRARTARSPPGSSTTTTPADPASRTRTAPRTSLSPSTRRR